MAPSREHRPFTKVSMSCTPASDMQICRTLSTIADEPVSSSHIFNGGPPSGDDSSIVHEAWPPALPLLPQPAAAAAAINIRQSNLMI
jgi:hypothetical protein